VIGLNTQKRRFRRGNAAVVGLSLGVVLGFGALAVDISLQRVADSQVQAAIEAAALGGAAALDRTISGLSIARQQAVDIANSNPVVGDWSITVDDVELGVYDPDTQAFTPVPNTTLAALETGDPLILQINAVRIATTHDGIAAVLANAAFGVDSLSTTNTATAARPNNGGTARSVPCYLPLAIPDCDYKDWMSGAAMTTNPPPRMFNQSSAIIDNIGWGRPQSSPGANEMPNTNYISSAFANGACHEESIELGQTMQVDNGQNTSVLKYIDDILSGKAAPAVSPTTWDHDVAPRPARDGVGANLPNVSSLTPTVWADEPVIQGPVALMKVPDEQCASNINFVGEWEISGFAWAMIYDVAQPSTKNIWVQLDFVNQRDFGGDVDDGGLGNVTGFDKPVLVF